MCIYYIMNAASSLLEPSFIRGLSNANVNKAYTAAGFNSNNSSPESKREAIEALIEEERSKLEYLTEGKTVEDLVASSNAGTRRLRKKRTTRKQRGGARLAALLMALATIAVLTEPAEGFFAKKHRSRPTVGHRHVEPTEAERAEAVMRAAELEPREGAFVVRSNGGSTRGNSRVSGLKTEGLSLYLNAPTGSNGKVSPKHTFKATRNRSMDFIDKGIEQLRAAGLMD